MTKSECIQEGINNVLKTVPSAWKQTKTTKKALAELESLGLTQYLPEKMTAHGTKWATSIAAVIDAAKDAGGKRETVGGFTSYGDGDVSTHTTKPSALYLALHSDEDPGQSTIPSESDKENEMNETVGNITIYQRPGADAYTIERLQVEDGIVVRAWLHALFAEIDGNDQLPYYVGMDVPEIEAMGFTTGYDPAIVAMANQYKSGSSYHGLGVVDHGNKNIGPLTFKRQQLERVMTTREAEIEFGLERGTVRQYLNHNADKVACRKSKSGGNWLISRSEAERIWGRHKS